MVIPRGAWLPVLALGILMFHLVPRASLTATAVGSTRLWLPLALGAAALALLWLAPAPWSLYLLHFIALHLVLWASQALYEPAFGNSPSFWLAFPCVLLFGSALAWLGYRFIEVLGQALARAGPDDRFGQYRLHPASAKRHGYRGARRSAGLNFL